MAASAASRGGQPTVDDFPSCENLHRLVRSSPTARIVPTRDLTVSASLPNQKAAGAPLTLFSEQLLQVYKDIRGTRVGGPNALRLQVMLTRAIQPTDDRSQMLGSRRSSILIVLPHQ